jgi:hypothetical protein
MRNPVYLFALAGLLGLTACQRQATGGFLPTHTEAIARTAPARSATPVQAVEAVAVHPVVETPAAPSGAVDPQPPALVVSTADRLVEAARGTRYEARVQRVKASLDAARTQRITRQPTGAERLMTKLVTKKLNRKLAEAQRGYATQRVDSNIKLGIVFLAIALVLVLLSQPLWGSIAAVIGLLFLILGLINQAGG